MGLQLTSALKHFTNQQRDTIIVFKENNQLIKLTFRTNQFGLLAKFDCSNYTEQDYHNLKLKYNYASSANEFSRMYINFLSTVAEIV